MFGLQGTAPTWFQGNSSIFPAFNGLVSGYVAANFRVLHNIPDSINKIDSWFVHMD